MQINKIIVLKVFLFVTHLRNYSTYHHQTFHARCNVEKSNRVLLITPNWSYTKPCEGAGFQVHSHDRSFEGHKPFFLIIKMLNDTFLKHYNIFLFDRMA